MPNGRPSGAGDATKRWVGRTFVPPVEARLARVVRVEVDRAVREVQGVEFRARRDLLAVGERDAARSTALWADEVMPTARSFTDPESTLRYGLEIANQGGLALEFGVFAGRSLRVIAEVRKGQDVYGFDSFRGLPEVYRPHVRDGAFALDERRQVDGADRVV